VTFTLAHLSDVHLPNMRKRAVFSNFEQKRVIGAFSWYLRRRKRHLGEIANAVRASILEAAPSHIALTGDLVNIAAWNEFPSGAAWLRDFAPPDHLTFVPGNHDAYVHVPFDKGLAHLLPWMASDRQDGDTLNFPTLRLRRNVALIGLNSGKPQRLWRAAGSLGETQLRDLSHMLRSLCQQGFYRVVMIHHPPLPGMAVNRKALTDAEALKQILLAEGCELVLHGHNHTATTQWLETKSGHAPIIGVPSASMRGDANHPSAAWNLYHINRVKGRWVTDMTSFNWNTELQSLVAGTPFNLEFTRLKDETH
jgi:3',5'-cyclic AMP phosphodiesterase CpdA